MRLGLEGVVALVVVLPSPLPGGLLLWFRLSDGTLEGRPRAGLLRLRPRLLAPPSHGHGHQGHGPHGHQSVRRRPLVVRRRTPPHAARRTPQPHAATRDRTRDSKHLKSSPLTTLLLLCDCGEGTVIDRKLHGFSGRSSSVKPPGRACERLLADGGRTSEPHSSSLRDLSVHAHVDLVRSSLQRVILYVRWILFLHSQPSTRSFTSSSRPLCVSSDSSGNLHRGHQKKVRRK